MDTELETQKILDALAECPTVFDRAWAEVDDTLSIVTAHAVARFGLGRIEADGGPALVAAALEVEERLHACAMSPTPETTLAAAEAGRALRSEHERVEAETHPDLWQACLGLWAAASVPNRGLDVLEQAITCTGDATNPDGLRRYVHARLREFLLSV
jgi:hypothetical protein